MTLPIMKNIAFDPKFVSLLKSLNHKVNGLNSTSSDYTFYDWSSTPFEINKDKYRFDSLKSRYMSNAMDAKNLETLIYSNIHNYDFKAMNISVKAHVDFLDLYFETDQSCSRHNIKKYLTEKTGIKHFVSEHEQGFIIRLHDVNSRKKLQSRIGYLKHFGCKEESFHIVELELAIDFYHFKHRALAIALLKSIRLPSTTGNFRVFKHQLGVFTPIPTAPHSLLKKLENGYNIGINRKDADEYWHIYVKTTDYNKQPLLKDDWRIRAEKNIKQEILSKMDNHVSNMRDLLLANFKSLTFIQLKDHAPSSIKKLYIEKVEPFGKEQKFYYDQSRHRRTLPKHFKKNRELNRLICNAVQNLVRNFAIN